MSGVSSSFYVAVFGQEPLPVGRDRSFVDMGINIGVVDRILLNFQRTAGLFSNLLITKVFAVIFLALSCLGTQGVKNQEMTWGRIYAAFLSGLVLFFMNWWMLDLPFSPTANAVIYTVTLTAGYILLLCRVCGSVVC